MFMGVKVKGKGHQVTLDENAHSEISLLLIIRSFSTPKARISKWHDIVQIIAQYTLHTFFHRDNKLIHVQPMSLDVSTKNSFDDPSKGTIKVGV